MMQFSRLFEIKPGKLDTFLKWMEKLNNKYRGEALMTLQEEGAKSEIYVLFEGKDGKYYVAGFNESKSGVKRGNPKLPINNEHNQIKEDCLKIVSEPGQILLELRVPESL